MTTHSTSRKRSAKPTKARSDFPLFRHATGRWAKKVKGKHRYFGYIAKDPQGKAAIALWLKQKDDLLAGRNPRSLGDELTVSELCNRFINAKRRKLDSGEIKSSTFADYYRTCDLLVTTFGRNRPVDDLLPSDFESLRARIAKKYGVNRLTNNITRIRSTFKYAYESGLIKSPVRFGPEFVRPADRVIRDHRNKSGPKMFEADEIRNILDAANQPLKAMILLGINCGFGNSDCGTLPFSALDLKAGWVNFPRPKTGIKRRCPLWPETVTAIREAIANRPAPKNKDDEEFVFLTRFGNPWQLSPKITTSRRNDGTTEIQIKGQDSPVSKAFRKLLSEIDGKAAKEAKKRGEKPPAKLLRKKRLFYALRHGFETIGGESTDQVAVDSIMGHADSSMAAKYREKIPSDNRLRAVTNKVRAWLFPDVDVK